MTSSEVESLRPQEKLLDHIALVVMSARFNRDLLEEVLDSSGRREKRVRRLPAHVMIRYVIAMGLFCTESHEQVMRRLVGCLRRLGSWDDDWRIPTASAITQARQRLGDEPVRMLFERACVPLGGPGAKGVWPAQHQLMAIDVTSVSVADTRANVERYGRTQARLKASAAPQLRIAALIECGSHAIVGAALGSCRTRGQTLAKDLAGRVGPSMLLLAHASLYSFDLFNSLAATGADLAWRVGASVSIRHLRWLADNSYQALIFKAGVSTHSRARLVEQARTGEEISTDLARLVRVVEYTVAGRDPDGELVVVVTTILDHHEVSAMELANAFQQRWENESALDEIRTNLCGCCEVIRSKTPDLVEQQIWGMLLAHYAIRALLLEAADHTCNVPNCESSSGGLHVLRRQSTDH